MLQSVARPYAKAAFEYADDQNSLSQWQYQLEALAVVANDHAVQALLSDPKVSKVTIAALFINVLDDKLDDAVRNFVRLLGERARLHALPAIHEQFQTLYQEKQRTITAKVFVADELTPEQTNRIKDALEKRLHQDVSLDTIIDPSIFGGIRVEAKDLVIDGSIRGRLQQLFENLNA